MARHMAVSLLMQRSMVRLQKREAREEDYLLEADNPIIVGLAIKEGKVVKARVLSSSSALDEGAKFTGQERPVQQVRLHPRDRQGRSNHFYQQILAPLTAEQVGSIRCIGVNYNDHGVSTT